MESLSGRNRIQFWSPIADTWAVRVIADLDCRASLKRPNLIDWLIPRLPNLFQAALIREAVGQATCHFEKFHLLDQRIDK